MTLLQRIEFWGERHHPRWMDIVRIGLGIFLIAKGVDFSNNFTMLMNLMPGWMSFGSFMMMLVGHLIVGAHILGGILITLGTLTRFACLIQIPILLGAVFFANTSQVFEPFSHPLVAVVVLLMLIYFLVASNGPWSFDKMYKQDKQ